MMRRELAPPMDDRRPGWASAGALPGDCRHSASRPRRPSCASPRATAWPSVGELRLALLDFAAWYNTHWLVARHGHRTPAQIRADQQPAMDQAA